MASFCPVSTEGHALRAAYQARRAARARPPGAVRTEELLTA